MIHFQLYLAKIDCITVSHALSVHRASVEQATPLSRNSNQLDGRMLQKMESVLNPFLAAPNGDDNDPFDVSLSYLLEEDDGDDIDFEEAQFLSLLFHNYDRKGKWDSTLRLEWETHVARLLHENLFDRTYRMSLDAFNKLVHLLHPKISCDVKKSYNSCGYLGISPIYPEMVVAIGICWLAGGSYLDLKNAYGCSRTSIYRARDLFLDAVNSCKELNLVFPQTTEEIKKAKRSFKKKSSNGIHPGCIGAIDGFLAKIKCPTMKECNMNPKSYYSGHYSTHGLNVQAVCDVRCRFIFFAVAAPGSTANQTAFEKTALEQFIQSLPAGIYIVGDAAYTLTDQVLVPFTGSQQDDPDKDAFNFFLSQL